jgi:hypothetical protein
MRSRAHARAAVPTPPSLPRGVRGARAARPEAGAAAPDEGPPRARPRDRRSSSTRARASGRSARRRRPGLEPCPDRLQLSQPAAGVDDDAAIAEPPQRGRVRVAGDEDADAHGLPDDLVEEPPGEPRGNRRQREDAIDVAQVAPFCRPPDGQTRHELRHDVLAERRVERVLVVADRVRRIELVAVLAVDEPVRAPPRTTRCTTGRSGRERPRAGGGNRTRVASLEGWSSTIELHPRRRR